MWRCSFFLLAPLSLMAEVLALYLSWYEDPTTTITIQWHTPKKEVTPFCKLNLSSVWQASYEAVEDRLVYHVTIKDLLPDEEYRLQIGDDPTIYRFRTAPKNLDQPIRFLVGGDLYQSKKLFQEMSSSLIEKEPLFAVLGGDIAYAIHPDPFANFFGFFQSSARRWFAFLKDWQELMITKEKRIIPFLLLPGNHDISAKAPDLFFKLFAFPEKKLYRSLDFGDYLNLILLDTGHLSKIAGEQTDWLKTTLEEKKSFPYLIPIYHVAAYPSYYSFNAETPKTIRKNWCPLFDEKKLPIAFENHNHSWKKTFPIRNEQLDPSGTIYLGDGCWGAIARKPKNEWYLDKKGALNHVYLIELKRPKATITAIGLFEKILDEFEIQPRD